MSKPLEGVRVLEVAIYAFAPSATAILGDWGADVVKIDHPVAGDPGRNTAAWGVPASVNGVSHLWDTLYRRAGIGPDDVDVAQIYDCFTSTPPVATCPRGTSTA